MTEQKAFIFDLNGTMIDDMAYHTDAWFDILNNDLKAGLNHDQVKHEMYGKNEEVLVRIFGKNHLSAADMAAISIEKERRYQKAFRPNLRLIAGLSDFLLKSQAKNIAFAIGSAAIPFNIDFVIDNLNIRHYFKAIVSADDVRISKPHPETYLKAAEALKVKPSDCIVFEDAPKGVESALNAGMESVVLTTTHEKHEFNHYSNVKFFISDYNDPLLSELLR